MAIQDEIYYTTPNGMKMSQTDALERYGSEQFDAFNKHHQVELGLTQEI